eukprot:6175295-Pleurochrysis_carterae.AAC.5
MIRHSRGSSGTKPCTIWMNGKEANSLQSQTAFMRTECVERARAGPLRARNLEAKSICLNQRTL